MKNEPAVLFVSAESPSLLRATAGSVAYALACVIGNWLLWHCLTSALTFELGLGLASTGARVQARTDTLLITLGTLLASGVFWQKSFLGYWHVHNQVGDNSFDARDGVMRAWRLLLSLLLMGWFAVDFFTVLGCLGSLTDDGHGWN